MNEYELAAPFKSEDDLQAAVDAFQEDVKALREKRRIANVFVILCASYEGADGISERLNSSHIGNHGQALTILAQTFGQWRARMNEQLDWMRSPYNK